MNSSPPTPSCSSTTSNDIENGVPTIDMQRFAASIQPRLTSIRAAPPLSPSAKREHLSAIIDEALRIVQGDDDTFFLNSSPVSRIYSSGTSGNGAENDDVPTLDLQRFAASIQRRPVIRVPSVILSNSRDRASASVDEAVRVIESSEEAFFLRNGFHDQQ